MKNIAAFIATLQNQIPDAELSAPMKALWYDAKGDWDQAHQQVDHLNGKDAAAVHAYLHRKEGDIFNARYWYNRAGTVLPELTLDEEWEILVSRFL